jgi:predicted dehydrogenase
MHTRAPGAIIVGTSFGLFTHLRALRAAGFQVKALVGRDGPKTAARAKRFDVPHALTSLDQALALPGVDIVTIATPPHTHHDIAVTAAKAGKHVMCEKPFARDLEQAKAMLAAVEKAGVVHMIGTEFRFATAQALLRRVVLDGTIGTPRHFFHALQIMAVPAFAGDLPAWWLDAGQGGGTFGAWGVHVIDQVRSTLGEFAAVHATLTTQCQRPGMTADDTFDMQFRLASGVTGTLACSMAAAGPHVNTVRIAGSKGNAWIENDQVWVLDAAGTRQIPVPPELANQAATPFPEKDLVTAVNDFWHSTGADLVPYTHLFNAMRARMEGRKLESREIPATFHDGVAAQAVMDAARASARQGRWVDVVLS